MDSGNGPDQPSHSPPLATTSRRRKREKKKKKKKKMKKMKKMTRDWGRMEPQFKGFLSPPLSIGDRRPLQGRITSAD